MRSHLPYLFLLYSLCGIHNALCENVSNVLRQLMHSYIRHAFVLTIVPIMYSLCGIHNALSENVSDVL